MRRRDRSDLRPIIALLATAATPATAEAGSPPDVVFQPPVTYDIGRFPTDVVAVDLTGDGLPDIVTANFISGDLSVLHNLGDGEFALHSTVPVGGQAVDLAAGDLDGDGDVDVAVALREAAGGLAVVLNDGTGSFGPAVQHGPAALGFSAALADLDGDGDLDVALVHGVVAVDILLNDGSAAFALAATVQVIEAPIVYVADGAAVHADGDGLIDLVIVNDCPLGCDHEAVVLHNLGGGVFSDPVPMDTPALAPAAIAAADLDADGDEDLAMLDCGAADDPLVLMRREPEGLVPAGAFPSGSTCHSFTNPMALAFGDVDGDGRPDAVLADALADEAIILMNQGDLAFDAPLAFATGTRPQATAVADVDGDGRLDVVTADLDDTSIDGTVSILFNDTPFPVVGDIDGDGDVDVADLTAVILAWGPCPPPPSSCAADVNGDGVVGVEDLVIVIQSWSSGR